MKKMVICVLLAAGLVLTGCDTGTGGGSGGPAQFVGTWQYTGSSIKIIEFKADLTWRRTKNGIQDATGTYAPNGNSAVLTVVNSDPLLTAIYNGRTITINGNSFNITEMGMTDTFTKIN